jgi:Mce-associated membrane protein
MKVLGRYLPWLLLVLALIAATTFGILWQRERSKGDEEDELRAQATEFIGDLTSISADTAQADADAIKEWAVGDFADEAEVFYGQKAIDAVVDAEATTEGEIQELFVQSLSEGEGSVFAVVDYTVTNAGTEEPKTDTVRLSIEMIDSDAGWKVNSVRLLESPGSSLPTGDG